MTKKSFIEKLPAIFQTVTEEKFFNATVDQVFSKKSSKKLSGFIGRRSSGHYDPFNDFYIPENTKERTRYQLEPTAVSKDPVTLAKTNLLFYQDLIDKIRSLGGNVGNHDRLFESDIYSFSPPIDADKFLNYRSYIWLPSNLPVFPIVSFVIGDFIGAATPPAPYEAIVNGMRLSFGTDIYVISGIGTSIVLTLENLFDEIPGQEFVNYPWDDVDTINDVDNSQWDNPNIGWDLRERLSPPDYITIERFAADRNAWSRTNKWFHLDVLLTTLEMIGLGAHIPANGRRGLRPIIEFTRDMQIYKGGLNFFSMVGYIFQSPALADPDDNTIMPEKFYDDIHGVDISVVRGVEDSVLWELAAGDTVVFKNHTELTLVPDGERPIKNFIWTVSESGGNFFLHEADRVVIPEPIEQDIIIINDGRLATEVEFGNRAETYVFENSVWTILTTQKTGANQAPLFTVYDIEGNALDNEFVYPESNFRGSKIFSYKENLDPEELPDPVLGFELTRRNSTHVSDIIFENNLMADEFIFTIGSAVFDIDGYPFYRVFGSGDDENDTTTWSFFNIWKKSAARSKQHVIDEHFVATDTQDTFVISTTPREPVQDNIDVILNGNFFTFDDSVTPVRRSFHFDNTTFANPVVVINNINDLKTNDSIRVMTFTHDLLPDDENGYFEIPSQLEVNPNNEEVLQASFGDLGSHMRSIIINQPGFEGDPLSLNNFRDTIKDNSVGTFIVQNESPLLKTMLVSSSEDLDLITAIRFAQNEYTTFRGNLQKTVKRMMDRDFVPSSVTQTLNIDVWVEEALKSISKARMFSKAFSFSYMIARGTPTFNETFITDGSSQILTNHVDLTDVKNQMYVYKVNGIIETLLLVDVDYTITDTSNIITLAFPAGSQLSLGDTVVVRLYENTAPAFIPSTPTKLGCTLTYRPRIIEDVTYSESGVFMVLGHDGSKTPTFGQYQTVLGNVETVVIDFRDEVLLEIERRIYNGIQEKFRIEYDLLLRNEHARPGKFRPIELNRYSREEYFQRITESFFSKWTAEFNLDFRLNEFFDITDFKTWNYGSQLDEVDGAPLPGNWRGIFDYFYDTQSPADAPWEMLGFRIKPDWWESTIDTGDGFIGYGSGPWGSAHALWIDIEAGLIRRGPRKGTDPLFIRPDLISKGWLPIDAAGAVRTPADIFSLSAEWTGTITVDSVTETLAKKSWVYGDGAPVEYVWRSSPEYNFSALEFLYLMKPSELGEKLWNPLVTGFKNGQFLDILTNTRANTKNVVVHGEIVDEMLTVSTGYQVYISDRLLFLNRDVTAEFGDKVRALTVNLAHKMAGFSNKDTMKLFMESVGASSLSGSLLIPENNYQLLTHESPSVREYVYSGVIVRALENGFSVHGYDLLSLEFKVMGKLPSSRAIQISEGGTPSNFKTFTFGVIYNAGDIVKNNNEFFQAAVTHEAVTFISTNWVRLDSLPTVGGLNVTYFPDRKAGFTRIQYGTVFDTAQDVFDFLIGYGRFLELEGWDFSTVSQFNEIENWLTYAKKFLFWAASEWETDNILFLSPNSEQVTLVVDLGYPKNIERISNGVYSILNKFGVSIDPKSTIINRNDSKIQVIPSVAEDAVFYLRVESTETEHVLLIDNLTDFDDVVYAPLFRARQNRLKFLGTKTMDWFGKAEAGGYLIQGDKIIPNFENQTTGIRDFYNLETFHDNVAAEEAARHLIGHETRDYLDSLEIAGDVQFSFYQGFIRQKGTPNAISKLLRSNNITDKDNIRLVEEWAVKQNEFGGLVDNATIEVVIEPAQLRDNPQLVRLTHVPSDSMVLTSLEIFNREEEYEFPPRVFIDPPGTRVGTAEPATAVAIIGLDRKIEKIEIVNPGRGYTKRPRVLLSNFAVEERVKVFIAPERNSSGVPNRDRVYATLHAEVQPDDPRDRIIDINIADTNKWILRPKDQDLPFTVPLSDAIDFQLPSAGYVNLNDVTNTAFVPAGLFNNWLAAPMETSEDKGLVSAADTCWVANNVLETWNVYKIVRHTITAPTELTPRITLEDDGNGFANLVLPSATALPNDPKHDLLTAYQREWVDILGEDTAFKGVSTDLTEVGDGLAVVSLGQTDGIIDATTIISQGGGYNAAQSIPIVHPIGAGAVLTVTTVGGGGEILTVTIDNGGAGYFPVPIFDDVTQQKQGDVVLEIGIINLKSSSENNLYQYVRVFPETPDPEADISYALYDTTNTRVNFDDIQVNSFILNIFKGMRFKRENAKEEWVENLDTYWLDDVNGKWSVFKEPNTSPFREQEPLINSEFYNNAFIRDRENNDTLALLSVLDTFKGLIPGVAEQNIDFKTLSDPARYNVSNSEVLFDPSSIFDDTDVGKTWWDLSTVRTLYYEQPAVKIPRPTDVTIEQEEQIALAYAQKHWGSFFPGSSINIYEWVESLETPDQYTGSGTPRSTTDYVQLRRFNPAKNQIQFFFYFWVRGRTEVPSRKNRSINTTEIERLLVNPRSFAFRWFAPVRTTGRSVTFLIANSQDILSGSTAVFQINYKTREHPYPEHVEWKLIREDDLFTDITDEMWNKLVDSLTGYTKPLPPREYSLGIPLDTVDPRTASAVVLPVPNLSLSPSERLGIKVRPQQSMFKDILEARRAVNFTINQLLGEIKIWLFAPGWIPASTSEYWEGFDWFAEGFDKLSATASRRVDVVQDLDSPTLRAELVNKELIQVLPAMPDANDRFEVYIFDKDDDSFRLIRREKGTVRLKATLYGGDILIALRQEFREILNSLRDLLFIDQLKININKIYISAVNYALSEQQDVDWVFKTTYVTLLQEGRTLKATQVLSAELQDEFIAYINEAKPYHTKLRDVLTTVETELDTAEGVAIDDLFFDIDMFFDRFIASEQAQTIDALGFLFNWDNTGFDIGGILVGIDDSGVEVEITGDFRLGWDSLDLLTALGGDENSFGDNEAVQIDAKQYVFPRTSAEELIPAQTVESVVIRFDTEVVDSTNLQRDAENVIVPTPISITITIMNSGDTKFARNSDSASTTLAQDVDQNSTVITVTDGAVFPSPSNKVPAAFWIGAERIEYFGKTGNILTNIRRATNDTFPVDHLTGDKVFVEFGNVPPDGLRDHVWFEPISLVVDTDVPAAEAIYLDTAGNLGDFFQNGPGTAN